MAIYCNAGDKPIVTYQFQGQNQKKYQSNFSPIDVTINSIPVGASANYNRLGYRITFTTSGDPAVNGEFQYTVDDYEVISWNGGSWIAVKLCGTWDDIDQSGADGVTRPRIYQTTATRWRLYRRLLPGSIVVNPAIRCPSAANEKCSIIISYNGQIIHQDQGNCPVTFDVSCGNCPPGTEEHKSSIYPGYCCLDCADVAAEIRGITNTIRGLNNG